MKVVCDESLRYLKMAVEGCRVIIQGFGNVGSNAARLLQERGYSIVGIAERDGGLYNPSGIDIHQLLEYKYRNNTILGFRGAEATPSEELLVSECEILIPAATENVITSRNADKIKAKIVVEGANGPTTAVADEILAEKRVFIVPDILANAGGVTASYFEWVQDRQGYFWKEYTGPMPTFPHAGAADSRYATSRLARSSLFPEPAVFFFAGQGCSRDQRVSAPSKLPLWRAFSLPRFSGLAVSLNAMPRFGPCQTISCIAAGRFPSARAFLQRPRFR